MEFSEFLRARGAPPGVQDELIYEFIADELSQNSLKQGLWTKALADAEWDEARAKAFYVRMRFQQIKNHVQDTQMTARQIARQRASELGLTQDEINYLDAPILAVHYVSKYGISKDDIALACAKRRITSVMSHGVLWVSDRPLKKLGWF